MRRRTLPTFPDRLDRLVRLVRLAIITTNRSFLKGSDDAVLRLGLVALDALQHHPPAPAVVVNRLFTLKRGEGVGVLARPQVGLPGSIRSGE